VPVTIVQTVLDETRGDPSQSAVHALALAVLQPSKDEADTEERWKTTMEKIEAIVRATIQTEGDLDVATWSSRAKAVFNCARGLAEEMSGDAVQQAVTGGAILASLPKGMWTVTQALEAVKATMADADSLAAGYAMRRAKEVVDSACRAS
jgi:hypothetical protein